MCTVMGVSFIEMNQADMVSFITKLKILWEKVVYIKQMITQISICIIGVIKENGVFEKV